MEQLKKKIKINGTIKALTGLHIGGTNSALGIGGPDSMVIRNPINNKPYIPGSSIKGKMRALLDINDGSIASVNMGQVKNGSDQNPEYIAAKLFGTARNDDKQRPSRVILRDGKMLTPEEKFNNTDLPYTESKTEVVIDRITSKAMPRQLERVPADIEFELNMIINVFDIDDEKELITGLFRAMKLLQDDYLGGNGSRGSGQVKFDNIRLFERDIHYYNGEGEEKEISSQYPFD